MEVEIKQQLEKFSELLTKAKSADPQALDSERGGIVSGLRNGHGVLLRSASPLLLRDLNAGIAEHDQEIKSACQELVEQLLNQNADRLDNRLTAEAENSRAASAALRAAQADLEKKLDQRVEEVAQEAAKLASPETREIQKRSEDTIQELQDMLAKARKIMSDEAFHQHAVAFNKSAKEYRKSARFWLGAAGLFAALTLGIAVWRLLDPDVSPERIIAQAIVTSILLTFTFVATRGYRIAVHNALIAEQRRDALATVDNFVAAADGEQSRTAVLLQATNAIFSFAPTTPGAEAGQDGLSTSALSILQEISKEKRRG